MSSYHCTAKLAQQYQRKEDIPANYYIGGCGLTLINQKIFDLWNTRTNIGKHMLGYGKKKLHITVLYNSILCSMADLYFVLQY